MDVKDVLAASGVPNGLPLILLLGIIRGEMVVWILGIGVGYIVKPIQEAYDEILNLRLDNVKLAMNKMFFMEASSSLFGQTPVMKIRP